MLVVNMPLEPKFNSPFRQNTSLSQQTQQKYLFKDDQVLDIFNILIKNNKIELLEPKIPGEVGHTSDLKYCHYQRIVNHSTKNYFILKDKFQALGDVDVLHLTKEKKKVTTNMISMQFGKELSGVKMPNKVLVPYVMTWIINIDPNH